jgi:hypothetical protein
LDDNTDRSTGSADGELLQLGSAYFRTGNGIINGGIKRQGEQNQNGFNEKRRKKKGISGTC